MNQREAIEKQVRIGVLDALEAKGPMGLWALEKAVESAADAEDIRRAVRQLTGEGLVCKQGSDIAVVGAEKAHASRSNGLNRTAQCLAALQVAGYPMTSAELEAAGAGERNTVSTLLNTARKRGAVVREKRGHVNVWSLPGAEPDDAPDAHAAEASQASGDSSDVEPIAEPSYLAADRPVNEPDVRRFALWSDGTLAIQCDEGDVDLPPDATRALIAYLIDSAPRVRAIFDGDAA